jgi:hypothetical protein
MSINVEILVGSLMVQHCIEENGQPDHLRLVSTSDVFTPTGRTKIGVIWDLSVKKIDDETCEFTNTVHSSATPELMDCEGSGRQNEGRNGPDGYRYRRDCYSLRKI